VSKRYRKTEHSGSVEELCPDKNGKQVSCHRRRIGVKVVERGVYGCPMNGIGAGLPAEVQ